MLASIPACILNQIATDSGIPLDSNKIRKALGRESQAPGMQRLNRLTARAVATLKKPGRHADGGGLYLKIDKSGAKRWTFMWMRARRQREAGLGSIKAVTLAKAREIAAGMRAKLAEDHDPIEAAVPPEQKSKAVRRSATLPTPSSKPRRAGCATLSIEYNGEVSSTRHKSRPCAMPIIQRAGRGTSTSFCRLPRSFPRAITKQCLMRKSRAS
jgi:hypothetical protein